MLGLHSWRVIVFSESEWLVHMWAYVISQMLDHTLEVSACENLSLAS